MARSLLHDPFAWSYGLAVVAVLAFALRLALTWRGGRRAWLLLTAALVSAAWAALTLGALAHPDEAAPWMAARIVDAARLAVWLAFVCILLLDGRDSAVGARRVVGAAMACLVFGTVAPQPAPWADARDGDTVVGSFAALLGAAVCGLVLLEQLYRRTPSNRRWAVKPLVLGLGGMFAFDVVMYSDAMLFRHLGDAMWAARGISIAPVMVFVAVATARNSAWTIDLHVSRAAVLHSGAVLAAGGYLVAVAAAAYWTRFFGGAWGEVLAVGLVFAALLALAAAAFSGSLRARLRVFVNKHFFSYRYDWREEWLRFTQALGTAMQKDQLYEQVLGAMANLVESGGGALWLQADGAARQAARNNFRRIEPADADAGSLAAFLATTGWVVRLDEYARFPQRYPGLVLPGWLAPPTEAWLVVPLACGADLVGFVVLTRPRAPMEVDWEVLDLLKTAGCQAASFLAQAKASEALLEAEKFGAFNRMSAFVVHDLKNLVSQLALLLKNAERHRDNPQFQRDMQATVENVLARMQRLLLQLREGTTPAERPSAVELGGLLQRIAKLYGDSRLALELEPGATLRVVAHEERIERVVRHLVQNALEALEGERGQVRIRSFRDGAQAVLEVADNGIGMSDQFVRERLFRPFQTTKAQGMGIGMNESFQYVNGIGGTISVESAPRRGSTFRLRLALA